jgi:predicted PurR-regulated permease PerM
MSEMQGTSLFDQIRNSPVKISYLFMTLLLLAVWALHLATPLLAALLSYLALLLMQKLINRNRPRGKSLTVSIFLILLAILLFGLWFFGTQTIKALPKIVDKAIPTLADLAHKYQVELPFTDYQSLRELTLDSMMKRAQLFGQLARAGATQIVFVIAGCVVAISFFLNPSFYLKNDSGPMRSSMYAASCRAVGDRFAVFFKSFATVMGAQIIISAINTFFTSVFVIAANLPYKIVVIGVTFLCGLLPVVGNLISNTVIVGIGLTISPRMGLMALIFLIVIHKLEYFLNSKIVGHKIRNPLWLTLLGLIVGERLMGVPGMILAPVVLHYFKVETSKIQMQPRSDSQGEEI